MSALSVWTPNESSGMSVICTDQSNVLYTPNLNDWFLKTKELFNHSIIFRLHLQYFHLWAVDNQYKIPNVSMKRHKQRGLWLNHQKEPKIQCTVEVCYLTLLTSWTVYSRTDRTGVLGHDWLLTVTMSDCNTHPKMWSLIDLQYNGL